ncbi:MAG: 2-amino-3,7-dideoxy-D-threo-hept-6-ulosonate synthase [Umezawaea sp.]
MTNTGKLFRMRRLSSANDGRHLFVPLDHSVSDGPVVPYDRWHDLLRNLVEGGADALIVHKGRARLVPPSILASCALVVHLSAGTAHAADTNSKVLVGEAEDALRVGADAVSVHVNIGSDTEERQLADLGAVATACEAWGLPLIAMIYPRGPRIADPHDPALLAHVVNIAADLGADLVKTSVTLPVRRMAEVIANSPIPVLAAGGPVHRADPTDGSDLIAYATELMAAGCAGLAVGRKVFTSPNPASLVARLAAVVHGQHATVPDSPAHQADLSRFPTMTTGAR